MPGWGAISDQKSCRSFTDVSLPPSEWGEVIRTKAASVGFMYKSDGKLYFFFYQGSLNEDEYLYLFAQIRDQGHDWPQKKGTYANRTCPVDLVQYPDF